ncbi:MAG: hypothetical protein IKV27_00080 [Lachnospiraceae bacterium]|nr:hypothetical protein [Lachnospiraceae bacterium]
MEKIKELNRYQKGILILLVAMAIIFGILYAKATSNIGFLYMDKIFEVSQENGNTVYSGKIQGDICKFVVTTDNTVTFQAGDRNYGPYKVKKDPSAIPKEESWAGEMTGVEVTAGEEILFRGGFLHWGNTDDIWIMVNEDGTDANITITATMSDGTIIDGDGNIVDPMEPSVKTIIKLVEGPELTHKGDWQAWVYALVISVITAVTILYADELFRLNLSFQIKDPDYAEPSDWEITGRYIGWTIMPGLALFLYIIGLQ